MTTEPISGPHLTSPSDIRPATVITGGSGGLGIALANNFLAHENDIVLVARDIARLTRALEKLPPGAIHRVHLISLDLALPNAPELLINALTDRHLYTDILVNNAATAAQSSALDCDPTTLNAMLDINIRTTTALMHRVLPDMLARRRGGILNIASLAGLVPLPGLSVYAASKAYLINLTRSLAAEVRGQGVRIAIVTPGPIDTGFLERAGVKRMQLLWTLMAATPQTVARTSYEGFLSGRIVIVPGALNIIAATSLKLLPQGPLIRALAAIGAQVASPRDTTPVKTPAAAQAAPASSFAMGQESAEPEKLVAAHRHAS